MAATPPPVAEKEYSDWAIESRPGWHYLGTSPPDETPVLYDPDAGAVYRGRVDHEAGQIVPDADPSWELDPGETIGQWLESFGETTGWDSISEFASEHLESDEDGS